jgi:hypothetical protein
MNEIGRNELETSPYYLKGKRLASEQILFIEKFKADITSGVYRHQDEKELFKSTMNDVFEELDPNIRPIVEQGFEARMKEADKLKDYNFREFPTS